jgi:flagellar motility protein MotE (MotC chaperone)
MNRILEIAAMALGGLSLFAVCFLGFATMAGVPLHQVALIGNLFPEPPEMPEVIEIDELEPMPAALGSDTRVYEASLGVLSAWTIESPFSGAELKSLAEELKLKREQLRQEIKELDRRKGEIDAREEALAEQFTALDEIRAKLEAFETELLLRAEEVARDEAVKASQDERVFMKLGELFTQLTSAEAKLRLTAYSTADATKILLHLPEKRAVEIINLFKGDEYLEYSRAWAEAAGAKP